MYFTHAYFLNVDKIETIEDIKIVLKSLQLSFDNPNGELKKFCDYKEKESVKIEWTES